MDRIKTVLIAAAIVAVAAAGNAYGQGCANGCNTTTHTGFGWSNGKTLEQRLQEHRRNFHAFCEHAEVVRQRNLAWPKPFQCHDRQAFAATFYPMYQRGYELQCTFSDAHFDDDNELNSAGKQKLAGIMANLPVERRQVLVFDTGNPTTTQTRISEVTSAIKEWWGHLPQPTIAKTINRHYGQAGDEVHQNNARFLSSLPTPAITAVSGGGAGAGGSGN